MKIPTSIFQKLQPQYVSGLFPLLEIELNGGITLEKLLKILQIDQKIIYNIVKADIEFSGKDSYGKLLLFLKGNSDENTKALEQFKTYKIKNNLVGYA